MKFEYQPRGPFNLTHQNQFFGGWLTLNQDASAIVMAFPVEGWQSAAAVTLRQTEQGWLEGEVHGAPAVAEKARDQALACLSLDVDGSGWPAIGQRDPIVGALQDRYQHLRPVLFHSPYEAAAGFIIGHRITIRQRQQLTQHMAQELGETVVVAGQTFHAFPGPNVLLGLSEYRGLSAQKVERLHHIAQAALDGWLDRQHLRALSIEQALQQLRGLSGVGPFFAQGILHRGAGIVDDVTDDGLTPTAIQKAYQLDHEPMRSEIIEIAEAWQPFRMWTTVLLHVWLRREVGLRGA